MFHEVLAASAVELGDSVEKHVGLGSALGRLGDNAAAIEAFRAALRLDPDNTGALYGLGIGLFTTGKLVEARSAFYEVLRVNPRNMKAQKAVSDMDAMIAMRDDAVCDDDATSELLGAARTRFEQGPGYATDAETLLRPLVESGHLVAIEFYIDRVMTSTNADAEAFESARKYWASRPLRFGIVRAVLALCTCAAQWGARSITELRKSLEEDLNVASALLLGDALLDVSEDVAGARKSWEQAITLSPNCRGARMRLGHLELGGADFVKGDNDYETTRAAVSAAEAMFNCAIGIGAASEYDDAIAYFALGSARAELLKIPGLEGDDDEGGERFLIRITALVWLEMAVDLSPKSRMFMMMRDRVKAGLKSI
tara:strand:- start:10824 stop:11930 length:1107 start_codon:yes stop_codon:yes gene_type:complete